MYMYIIMHVIIVFITLSLSPLLSPLSLSLSHHILGYKQVMVYIVAVVTVLALEGTRTAVERLRVLRRLRLPRQSLGPRSHVHRNSP